MFGNCDLTVTLTFDAEEFARLKAMQSFTTGFSTDSLTGSSLAEVCAALKELADEYETLLDDFGDEDVLEKTRALLARLQPTDTGDSHD